MFGWFAQIGITEEQFRQRVYMAAVCRCFPGKAEKGGDRVPSPFEVEQCRRHLEAEVRLIKPRLVIPVGKLAIAALGLFDQVDSDKLVDVVGGTTRTTIAGVGVDVVALPHPSGASTWHRTEPGKTLLATALATLSRHEAWRTITAS
jgi:uracil-DNA glycosylase